MKRDPDARVFATKEYLEVNGRRMAYVEEGHGDSILFQHGNPASSYLWRDVMPHLRGLGRLIACDLIGMGDSDKLTSPDPDRYRFEIQRDDLHAMWEGLALGRNVILVLHDWGSALGFDWIRRHPGRVQGVAYMEAITAPLLWDDYPVGVRRSAFEAPRSAEGEALVLEQNMFVERVLPSLVLRKLNEAEMAEYRRPFVLPGEARRPTLTWPRQLPIDGTPASVNQVVGDYAGFMETSPIPKLFINARPGALLTGRLRGICRSWQNQKEVSVRGSHFLQEDSPDEIGAALRAFVKGLRETA